MATEKNTPTPTVEANALTEQLAQLQKQLKQLESTFAARLEALEARLGAPKAQPAPAEAESITPELLAVIAAAVTSFLGKKVRIRSARQIAGPGMSPWAQQGRVYVQASHHLGR